VSALDPHTIRISKFSVLLFSSCNCETKTTDPSEHDEQCKYRLTCELIDENDRMRKLIKECDEYLDISNLTCIYNSSIFHEEMKELLNHAI